MEIREWLTGKFRVKIISVDPQNILNVLLDKNIIIKNVHWIDDMIIEVIISNKGKRILLQQSRKGLCEFFILETFGLTAYSRKVFGRWFLLIGIFIYLCLTVYLQNNILFVHVSGNNVVHSNLIIEQAGNQGLRFGCSKRNLRSEQIKNNLLESIPALQWVGINTSGCVATIHVKERVKSEEIKENHLQFSNIIASKNGMIRSVISLRGIVTCEVGQYVTAGQTLISGIKSSKDILVFTDAAGEVIADTEHCYTVLTPRTSVKRGPLKHTIQTYSIIFGKKLINFNNSSRILDPTCVKMISRNKLTLPGDFVLPISFNCTSVKYYTSICDSAEKSCDWMLNQCNEYAKEQMISGEIVERFVLPFSYADVSGYRVYMNCREMIGQVKKEELINIYG